MAIVLNETPASRSGTSSGTSSAGGAGSSFPATAAEAYALQFGSVYLNFSPATSGQRASQLAAFVPSSISGADPQLGWNGSGTLRLDSEQVSGIAVQGSNRAVVTLLATVNGQLMQLGVPIYTANGAFAVSGDPAWLPAPAQAAPPSASPGNSDPTAQAALNAQLPAFFQAYASGETATLNRFLAPGASVTGLGGSLSYVDPNRPGGHLMTRGSVRPSVPLAGRGSPGEPSPTRRPCYPEKAYYLKEAWSPGVPGSSTLAGTGWLSVSAGRFRLPAWLISDPGREE
jgi:hypothetical protein